IPPIEIKGNKFFYSNNGSQFFIKGIAYQQSSASQVLDSTKYLDPLSDEKKCFRDIKYLKELSMNLIRVYSINPKLNHDVCMNALADAGIYVLVDLSEPDVSINRKAPSWDVQLYDRYKSVIDALAKYNNVFGFFAGNEVTSDPNNAHASPFVKAAIRDAKSYISSKNYRKIPVGYSSNDDSETRDNLANYFICGNKKHAADFYGINMYEWCGYSSFFSSGYSERTVEFQDYPVPIFFSEYGCNVERPRPFTEVEAIYSPLMSNVWSGGIVYMYFEEENKYGVVKVDESENVKKLDDFRYLRDQMSKINPKGTNVKDYVIQETRERTCPVKTANWEADGKLPPTPDSFMCECLESSLSCIVTSNSNLQYKKLYEFLCGEVDCSSITADGKTGEYGYYSSCNNKQKLSLMFDEYYTKESENPKAC
ncbi:1,3-beta-glucanosyltransferase, partial [Ascoidea rubescens DSM 1968]